MSDERQSCISFTYSVINKKYKGIAYYRDGQSFFGKDLSRKYFPFEHRLP